MGRTMTTTTTTWSTTIAIAIVAAMGAALPGVQGGPIGLYNSGSTGAGVTATHTSPAFAAVAANTVAAVLKPSPPP